MLTSIQIAEIKNKYKPIMIQFMQQHNVDLRYDPNQEIEAQLDVIAWAVVFWTLQCAQPTHIMARYALSVIDSLNTMPVEFRGPVFERSNAILREFL